MPVHNSDVAEIFNEVADLLEIQGENPFRVRAYRNAARVVSNWPAQIQGILQENKELPKLPGVGQDLAGKIGIILKTGRLPLLTELKSRTPEGLLDLLKLPGLGPKRVRALQERLGIETIRQLVQAAKAGKIQSLAGFGLKIEKNILEEIGRREGTRRRVQLAVAEQSASSLARYLRAARGVGKVVVAGSFRRRLATVGDLDILASCESQAGEPDVMKRFLEYEDVKSVIAHGPTKSTVLLRSGLQVDLRVVPEKSYGAALYYFTGSKAHNIAVRALGLRRGLKINEYGVFRGTRRIAGATESEVFSCVGLPYIEPELREDQGEIQAARKGRLPRLIELQDIRGDLHAHTDETDGRLGLEAMALAARRRGYEYLAITDHSKRLTVAKGLTAARLGRQIRRIDELNAKLRGFRVLKSIEVDILEDGSLDLPDEILSMLDIVVCSIHSKFDLSAGKQTERIIRAMDHPCFHILGHPTGRLIGEREPYRLDIERIMGAARDRGCFLEVNAQPERMDLSDVHCRMAKEMGVPVVISTDAHSDNDLDYMRFGISQARRGWLEAKDVVNTRSWPQIQRMLRKDH